MGKIVRFRVCISLPIVHIDRLSPIHSHADQILLPNFTVCFLRFVSFIERKMSSFLEGRTILSIAPCFYFFFSRDIFAIFDPNYFIVVYYVYQKTYIPQIKLPFIFFQQQIRM